MSEADIARLFWIAIGLAGLTALYAALSARDLVYDGAYYLLRIVEHSNFVLFEHARPAAQILQQCLAVAGARAGVGDLLTLGRLFSLGMSGWPVILTAACWPILPKGEKGWIIGPLLNLVMVIPTTNFIGIGEGSIASCLLWLLFLLVLFRMREPLGAALAIALTIVGGFAHEAAFPFMAGLSLLAVLRARDARGLERAALIAVAALAALASLHLLYWVVFPRDTIERTEYLLSFLGGFIGRATAPNMGALASLVAVAAFALLQRRRGFWRGYRPIWAACAAFAAIVVLLLVRPDETISPYVYFEARGLPVMFTMAACFAIVLLRERKIAPERFLSRPVAGLLLGLMLTQAVTELVMTARWRAYLDDMRAMTDSRTGAISIAESSRALNPGDSRFRRELLEAWSVEPLSIVLAPRGRVQAVILPANTERWMPYHPTDPATLPRAPQLDWRSFSP